MKSFYINGRIIKDKIISHAVKSAYILNQEYKAKTPIIDAVYQILYEGKNAKNIFSKLTEKLD